MELARLVWRWHLPNVSPSPNQTAPGFVELAPIADEKRVPQAAAAIVSVPFAPGTEPLSVLVTYFRARHALLILDNCEHLLVGCSTLADGLPRQCSHLQIWPPAASHSVLLASSAGAVPSLAAPTDERLTATQLRRYSPVELFGTPVQSALPRFALTPRNAQTVGRICTRLDGIQLVLELAAPRARTVPLAAIAHRLRRRCQVVWSRKSVKVPIGARLAQDGRVSAKRSDLSDRSASWCVPGCGTVCRRAPYVGVDVGRSGWRRR